MFRRVCTESLPPIFVAWMRADGTFLGATPDGVVRVEPSTCADAADPAMTGRITRFVPIGPTLYAVEYLADGAGAIHRSDDDGDTFSLLPPLPGSWRLDTLGADGRGRPVVTGLDDGELQVAVYDGDAYVPLEVPPDPDAFVLYAFGPSPDGVGVAVATVTAGTGAARLWASSDAGWVHLVDVPSQPTGYGCVEAGCMVATAAAAWRWDPQAGAASLAEVPMGSQCLFAIDGALWGCSARKLDTLIEVTRDTLVVETALLTDATLERDCSTDCGPLPTTPPDTAPPADPTPPVVEPTCGCAARPPPAQVLGLAAALLCARRRKTPVC